MFPMLQVQPWLTTSIAETVIVESVIATATVEVAIRAVAVQNVFMVANFVWLMHAAIVFAVNVTVTVVDAQVCHAGTPCVLGPVGMS